MKRLLAALTSLLCVIGLLGCNDGNRLTLDRVVELSAKGEDLTWSDFERYESKDVGSGLYIYFYDIDDTFGLWIGGVPGDKPMYMRLATKANMKTPLIFGPTISRCSLKQTRNSPQACILVCRYLSRSSIMTAGDSFF